MNPPILHQLTHNASQPGNPASGGRTWLADTTIVVPDSTYRLDEGSLQVPNDHVVTFVVDRDGRSFSMDADCADGELNGYAPTNAAEAQLLNAACQVAFGGS